MMPSSPAGCVAGIRGVQGRCFDTAVREYGENIKFVKKAEELPGMASRGRGSFAAISSMAAAVPFVGYAAYSPAKAACRSFVDVLRNEYADTPLQFHVAFPPDTQTPGYERENATKPWETSHVWPEVFNETCCGWTHPCSVQRGLSNCPLNLLCKATTGSC